MDILLTAGLWLDGSTVWDDVVAHLDHPAVPIALPGQGDGNTAATLADQLAAVLSAVDAATEKPVVVGHSAACTLAWLAADARPERIAKVVLIGGFPTTGGQPYAEVFEIRDGVMAFPGWDPFDGPDAVDLDEPTRQRMAAEAIPVPAGVASGIVRYTDERRFDVPVTVICPEFSPTQAQKWIDAGEIPELAAAKHLELVDIDSGHWPMITRPAELARLLDAS
jgi:pimeloyl-ACP methyl ester carboxylesterase